MSVMLLAIESQRPTYLLILASMNRLNAMAFLSMAEITQVLSPRVEMDPTGSGKTFATLYCNLDARTSPDILDIGIVSPSLRGVTQAFAQTMFEMNLCFPGMKSSSSVLPTLREEELLEPSA